MACVVALINKLLTRFTEIKVRILGCLLLLCCCSKAFHGVAKIQLAVLPFVVAVCDSIQLAAAGFGGCLLAVGWLRWLWAGCWRCAPLAAGRWAYFLPHFILIIN